MKVERVSTSAELPVKLEQLKEHLRIMSDDFDSILTLHLKAAIASAEEFTGQVIWPGNYRLTADFDRVLKTGIMPVTGIVSVCLDGEELKGIEIGISGSSLCLPEGIKGDSVVVEFTAGFREVPFDVTAAILLTAAKFFENPSDSVEQLPKASTNLLRPHKRWGR
ncbi:head-tail connector protein [Odoribacter splanchnicus]|uniref:head-tail connector protein n=1 Tax=Odoribacter splanchnicus TaxID=28118 RepID=UPI00189962A8|nr:head-tail connector protein [Odoribacter splanchnicus]